jgi:hypothetical protein
VRRPLKIGMASYGFRVTKPTSGHLDIARVIRLKPDIEIFQNTRLVLLLDCKYRRTDVYVDSTL